MEIVRGARLWWIILSLCIGLLLSSLESTIVATALVSIGSDFHNYEQSNWVVVIYLVTYSGFLIIYARLSDITGRKSALLTGLTFFTISSLACGLAQSLRQLIVFRTFQGLGGAGVYALVTVVVAEITPPEQFGIVSGLLGMVFAAASALGPVIGGAITSDTTWRWCFLLNVPSGALVILLISIIFPKSPKSGTSFRRSLNHVDWLGCILSLAASITVIIPLEEGGDQLPWNSPAIIALFVIGGFLWIAFAAWETCLARMSNKHIFLPLIPVHIVVHRIIGACILTAMLTGVAFTGTIVYLPQRFQVVNNLSPVEAGIRMLPMVVTSALAFTVAGIALVGLGLMSSLHNTVAIANAEYGYQVVLGMGTGAVLCACVVLARIEVRREDIAPTMGALTQLRVFGGVMGVALCRVTLSSYVTQHLSQILSSETIKKILSSVTEIEMLPPDQAESVRRVYGDGFSSQARILMYIAAANVLVSFLCLRRHRKPIKDLEVPPEDLEEGTA